MANIYSENSIIGNIDVIRPNDGTSSQGDSVYAKPSLILVSNKESGEIYLFDCKEYAETFGYYYSDVKAYWDNAISNDNSWLGFDYFLWESSDFESRLDQTIVDKLIEYFGADEVSVFSDAPLTSVNSIKNNLYVGSNPDPVSKHGLL